MLPRRQLRSIQFAKRINKRAVGHAIPHTIDLTHRIHEKTDDFILETFVRAFFAGELEGLVLLFVWAISFPLLLG